MSELGRLLNLEKTHDACPSGNPRLTVVFIHGLAADSSSFAKAIEYLEEDVVLKDIRYVAYDLLGSGKSPKDDKLDYGYHGQIAALENSLGRLDITTPLVLVGHSMGTMIAAKYAYEHKKAVDLLILCSPPIYTEKDLDSPAFEAAIAEFKRAVGAKNPTVLKEKSFDQSINKIIKNRKNYKRLVGLTTPAVLIYGSMDPIIAPNNILQAVRSNPKYLSKICTAGRHGMSQDKYVVIQEILAKQLEENT